jgi:hypothetical protein
MKYLRVHFCDWWGGLGLIGPLSGPFELHQHCDTESLRSLHLDVAIRKDFLVTN